MNKQAILIIEDNPLTLDSFRLALNKEGYYVYVASDGKTALDIVKKQQPNMILQDLILPDMDGIELTKQLRKLPNATEVPIILMSGGVQEIHDEILTEVRVYCFLAKPFPLTTLVETIKKWLPTTQSDEKIGSGKKVLYVEDEALQMKLGCLQLKKAGFETIGAPDAKTALEVLQTTQVDAVISDILMPGMDGFELCLQVRQNPNIAHIPIILLSSRYTEEEDLKLAKMTGANELLPKSTFDLNLMQSIINAISSGGPPVTLETIFMDFSSYVKEEHTFRILHQLERHVKLTEESTKRCTSLGSELAFLTGILHLLAKNGGKKTNLVNILNLSLETCGLSKGALYLIDSEKNMRLHAVTGFEKNEESELYSLVINNNLFLSILMDKKILITPGIKLADEVSSTILEKLQLKSGAFIAIISENQLIGMLLFFSNQQQFNEKYPLEYVKNIPQHIADAIILNEKLQKENNKKDST